MIIFGAFGMNRAVRTTKAPRNITEFLGMIPIAPCSASTSINSINPNDNFLYEFSSHLSYQLILFSPWRPLLDQFEGTALELSVRRRGFEQTRKIEIGLRA